MGETSINATYFRGFNDEELLLRLKEANAIWLRLIMVDTIPIYAEAHQQTIAFWQQNCDDLEAIAKERNLIP